MANAAETLATEEIFITSTPKATQIHAGGWVGFKPSAKKQSNVSVCCSKPPKNPMNRAMKYLYSTLVEW